VVADVSAGLFSLSLVALLWFSLLAFIFALPVVGVIYLLCELGRWRRSLGRGVAPRAISAAASQLVRHHTASGSAQRVLVRRLECGCEVYRSPDGFITEFCDQERAKLGL
jgi:hypothetical protein